MRLISNLLLGVVVAGVFAVRVFGADVVVATGPALVPQVTKFEAGQGVYVIDKRTVVLKADTASKPVADYFSKLLSNPLGGNLDVIVTDVPAAGSIRATSILFTVAPDMTQLGAEGYDLTVKPEGIQITAATPAGCFYACQTLRQLIGVNVESKQMVAGGLSIPACTIEDMPRYPWRGALIDSCRHFYPKETIERFIDLMAYHKMNTLQWHLTDDQGWRIEIKKYPKLTSISAWRLDGPTGSGTTQPAPNADGSPAEYGGFYTQDDIREVVAYAKARYVTIVPEIEMPGHAVAALAAYPGLSCTGGPFDVGTRWGVYKDVYDPSKEETFTFIENVLDEVCTLFPGEFVHVGGDECPKDRWKESDACQALMKKLGLKNEDELQSYFIKRIEAYLETKHKRLIGWNEILQGGLPPGAAVTSWQGMSGGDTAAKSGHDVVMCPESNCYFDHLPVTVDDPKKGLGTGSTVPLNKVYAFEPTPPDLTPEQAKHILGAQGNLWSERIPTQDQQDFMAFPRMAALAEVLWTGKDRGDFPHFTVRLAEHMKRLDALGVKYFDDPLAHATMIGSWQPSDKLPKTAKELTYNVTDTLTAPGNYTVRFEYLDGKGRLDIDSVSLTANDQELSHDTHPGSAGAKSKGNAFTFTVPPLEHTTYTLHATIRATAGPDTSGQIFLFPTAIAPASSTQPAVAKP